MLSLDAGATQAALPFGLLIDALSAMFATTCQVPPRQIYELSAHANGSTTSLVMPAWTEQHYGVKVVNVAPGNHLRHLPGLHSAYLLFDTATGEPLALIDGNQITARRTAAASALAASRLAREDARRLLVVGAGRVASLLPQAYAVVRPISQVWVWARDAAKAESLALEWRGQGIAASAVASLREAAAEADIVSCATMATDPVISGHWLTAGSHLDLIGSFTPTMREADDACFAGANLFVDTDEAMRKSGDLLGPLSRGIIAAHDVRATLADLVTGRHPGRRTDTERTVFKSVGTALEDLAAGVLAHGRVSQDRTVRVMRTPSDRP